MSKNLYHNMLHVTLRYICLATFKDIKSMKKLIICINYSA